MKSLERCINQIDNAFDQLLIVARKLMDISLQKTSEDDILPLQKQQEELLKNIWDIDQYLQSNHKHELNSAMHDKFHAKLQEFQKLNKQFISNLNTSQGLILFEPSSTGENAEEGEKIPNLPLAHRFTTNAPKLLRNL